MPEVNTLLFALLEYQVLNRYFFVRKHRKNLVEKRTASKTIRTKKMTKA